MKTRNLILSVLIAAASARADFNYVMTRKGAATAGDNTTKYYLKGQKMKTDSGSSAVIIDYDAQTVTMVNNTQKTYTVTKFGDVGKDLPQSGIDVSASVKETGQHKIINGFNATQLVMTMNMDSPQAKAQGITMAMEMEFWISPDVPGAGELRAFYQRNAAKTPWHSIGTAGGNPQMQAAMADVQKKLASMNGVPVLQVVRTKMSGGAADKAAAMQNDPRMAQARAQMEEMAKKGGPQGDAAKQALARMGGSGMMASPGGMEITTESSGFSTASIPDSIFAIPAGYQQQK
jgi:hypothetical protein